MSKNQIRCEVSESKVKFDILDLIECLDEEDKKRVCDYFTYDHIFDSLERQLKHKTEFYSWDTSGWRDGSKMREFVINLQGLEPEFKADLESKISSLTNERDNYEKYYKWYFNLYHHSNDCYECKNSEKTLFEKVKDAVGTPEKPKEMSNY